MGEDNRRNVLDRLLDANLKRLSGWRFWFGLGDIANDTGQVPFLSCNPFLLLLLNLKDKKVGR